MLPFRTAIGFSLSYAPVRQRLQLPTLRLTLKALLPAFTAVMAVAILSMLIEIQSHYVLFSRFTGTFNSALKILVDRSGVDIEALE